MTIYYTVYKTSNLVNGREYIGVHKTKDPFDRYLGSNRILKQAIDKYGRDNFTKEILEYCDSEDEMFKAEARYVNEEWVVDPNTYNIGLGGRGWSGLGQCTVNRCIGFHAASFEQRSKWSKERIANTPRDVLLERCRKGGKKGGMSNYLNGTGFFILTKEQRIEISKRVARKVVENKLGIHGATKEQLSEWGSKGDKHKGFLYITDGQNTFKYTPAMQENLPFEEFLKQNPAFKRGRAEFDRDPEKVGNGGKTSKGSRYYTDGVNSYRYTKIMEAKTGLSFDEFIARNPQYRAGKIHTYPKHEVKRPDQTKWVTYNDGVSIKRYTTKQQEDMPFEEFLKQNPHCSKGVGNLRKQSVTPKDPNYKHTQGIKYYNDGNTNYSYKRVDQEKLPFDEFLKQNPDFVLGRLKNTTNSTL